jgi:type VI secretion system secreted protein VgrG
MVEIPELPITLTCAAAPDLFRLRSISGSESLGTLYEYHLDLASESHDVELVPLLGQPLIVHVPLGEGHFRHFGGIISTARRGEREGDSTGYHLTIAPEYELLSYSHDCRIFQNMTVIDVAKKVFADHGLRPCREAIFEKYRKWDYLTQYRESDFEFVRRILAAEGIYFFFDHLADGSRIVLADSVSAHQAIKGWDSVRLVKSSTGRRESPDVLRSWQEGAQLATNGVSLRDFDFRLRGQSAILDGRKDAPDLKGKAKRLRHEYPGLFALHPDRLVADSQASLAEGERLATVRLEEKQSRVVQYAGEGSARNLHAGSLFSITGVPTLAGRKFLITSTEVTFANPAFETGTRQPSERSHVRLTAIDATRPFRMPRIEKPVIFGPQTAVVVGAKDEEIWTDKYGRIRVQFPWDRAGKSNENSTCWVRVAQQWAGNHWGAIHIPRVGNEVVVSFIDGDPDRPLVTGSVYNADNMPPYELPTNQTQSGIKSRSSKGGNGSNFNEIRFEDKKGQEELHVQAERDMTALVKNDQTTTVEGKRSLTVNKDESVTVGGIHEMTVTKSVTETFKDTHTLKVAGDQDVQLTKNKSEHVKLAYDLTTDERFRLTQGDTSLTFVGTNVTLNSAGVVTVKRGNATVSIDNAEKVKVSSPSGVTLECGGSKIELSPKGIAIAAESVTASGGASKLALKNSGTEVKSEAVRIEAEDVCSLVGGNILKLNTP